MPKITLSWPVVKRGDLDAQPLSPAVVGIDVLDAHSLLAWQEGVEGLCVQV